MEKAEKERAKATKCLDAARSDLCTIRGSVAVEFCSVALKAGKAVGVSGSILEPGSKWVTDSGVNKEVFKSGSAMCNNIKAGLFCRF